MKAPRKILIESGPPKINPRPNKVMNRAANGRINEVSIEAVYNTPKDNAPVGTSDMTRLLTRQLNQE